MMASSPPASNIATMASPSPPAPGDDDALYTEWIGAHASAYQGRSPGPGFSALKAVVKKYNAALVLRLVRSPGVIANRPFFACRVSGYIRNTWNGGLDKHYFDILDAMVAEPAGKDASTLVSYVRSNFDAYSGGLPHYLGVAFRTRYVALMAAMNVCDRAIALADIAAAEAAGEPLPLSALLRTEQHDRFCATFDTAADPTRTPIERAVRMLEDYAGCGLVLPLRHAGLLPEHPAHEHALRAILGLCRRVADESPVALVQSMPRGCPGCLWLNLVVPVALHEALEPASRGVMCALLRDPQSRARRVQCNSVGAGKRSKKANGINGGLDSVSCKRRVSILRQRVEADAAIGGVGKR